MPGATPTTAVQDEARGATAADGDGAEASARHSATKHPLLIPRPAAQAPELLSYPSRPGPPPAAPSPSASVAPCASPWTGADGDVAPGMGAELKMKVLYGSVLEETMSRRQLHEAERGAVCRPRGRCAVLIRDARTGRTPCRAVPARSCGMEALDAAQHRAKAKFRKALEVWVSVPSNVTPDIQSRPRSTGIGGGAKLCVLTQGDLCVSASSGRWGGGNDDPPRHAEKSDHPVVVMKPGNAGGAKGVTG